MTRLRASAACLLCLLGVLVVGQPLVAAVEPPEPTGDPLHAVRVDTDEVARLLREREVDSRIARAGIGTYVSDIGVAFSRWVAYWTDRLLPGASRWLTLFGGLGPWLFFAVALLLLLTIGLALLRAQAGRRGAATRIDRQPHAVQAPVASDPTAVWEQALRDRLAANDPAAALEAMWWWLASRLHARTADAAWTGRELVQRADRPELLPLVRDLDRLTYGAEPPRTESVRRFWATLQGSVG